MEILCHVAAVAVALKPCFPGGAVRLPEWVFNNAKVALSAAYNWFVEKTETKNVGHGSMGLTNLTLLIRNFLFQIEAVDFGDRLVNWGFAINTCCAINMSLNKCIGVEVDLHNLADEYFVIVGWVRASEESDGWLRWTVGREGTSLVEVPHSSVGLVEHFYINNNN